MRGPGGVRAASLSGLLLAAGLADTAAAYASSASSGAGAVHKQGEQLWEGAAGPNYYSGDSSLSLQFLSAYPDAVCNDGSAAGYYYRQGTDPSLFVLFLEGGYWCVDEASCHGRNKTEPAQMSSTSWPPTIEANGIFSTDSALNPWAAASVAYVGYCSSDAWFGDTEAFGLQFRGQAIVNAAVQDLQRSRGLGKGTRLLFGGCSAGARGVMAHLDNVAAVLPGVDVRGMLDSGIWIDDAPADASVESLADETEQVAAFVNPGRLIPPACTAMYPQPNTWKCLFGQYRMPFVQTPYFANQAQFDSFQVEYNNNGKVPHFRYQVEWADKFQLQMRAEMLTLPTAAQEESGVFSSVCLLHCVFDTPDFWTIKVGNVSLESALSSWYFDGEAPVQIVDQSCTGWACHTECQADELPALSAAPFGGEGNLDGPPGPKGSGQGAPPWQYEAAQQQKAALEAAAAAMGSVGTAAQVPPPPPPPHPPTPPVPGEPPAPPPPQPEVAELPAAAVAQAQSFVQEGPFGAAAAQGPEPDHLPERQPRSPGGSVTDPLQTVPVALPAAKPAVVPAATAALGGDAALAPQGLLQPQAKAAVAVPAATQAAVTPVPAAVTVAAATSKPATVPAAVAKPAAVPAAVAKPAVVPGAVAKPAAEPAAVAKPAAVPAAVPAAAKPAAVPAAAVAKPAVVPAAAKTSPAPAKTAAALAATPATAASAEPQPLQQAREDDVVEAQLAAKPSGPALARGTAAAQQQGGQAVPYVGIGRHPGGPTAAKQQAAAAAAQHRQTRG